MVASVMSTPAGPVCLRVRDRCYRTVRQRARRSHLVRVVVASPAVWRNLTKAGGVEKELRRAPGNGGAWISVQTRPFYFYSEIMPEPSQTVNEITTTLWTLAARLVLARIDNSIGGVAVCTRAQLHRGVTGQSGTSRVRDGTPFDRCSTGTALSPGRADNVSPRRGVHSGSRDNGTDGSRGPVRSHRCPSSARQPNAGPRIDERDEVAVTKRHAATFLTPAERDAPVAAAMRGSETLCAGRSCGRCGLDTSRPGVRTRFVAHLGLACYGPETLWSYDHLFIREEEGCGCVRDSGVCGNHARGLRSNRSNPCGYTTVSGSHGHGVSAAGRHRRPLIVAFGLTACFMVVELVAGFVTNSLALLSDAAHMGTDVLGLGMALAAVTLAARRPGARQTFGRYRLEVLAAVANGLLLFGVAGYVLIEAYRRIDSPPEVPGLPLLVVALVGLVVNFASFRLLTAGAKESLNLRGAYLEVLADLLGSVGVIVAAIIIYTTGWRYADPLIGAGIGLFILPRTWKLTGHALRILMQAAPPEIDMAAVYASIRRVPGVADIHDLHIWTVTSGIEVASGHVVLADGADLPTVLDRVTELLSSEYGIDHITVQCEPGGRDERTNAI